jgi:hypothetical protein
VAIVLAHMPLGLLPHLGNKLWALKSSGRQLQFVRLAFAFGLTLGMLGLGGLLSRAVLGDALFEPGPIPMARCPSVHRALSHLAGRPDRHRRAVGGDEHGGRPGGVVVADRRQRPVSAHHRTACSRQLSEEALDRRVLWLSRVSTVVVLMAAMAMAWALMDVNIALIVWIGTGGMMAAFAGPLVVGALWRGVTAAGAYAGLVGGFGTFLVLHTGVIDPLVRPARGAQVALWLRAESPNPYSCAAMGELG